MAGQGYKRRLTTIVASDVVGYSRLISADEEGTLETLWKYRKEVVDPTIAHWRGRIANTAGDSVLAEFPSVVDGVRCFLRIQESLAEQNVERPEATRVEFRVGINVGDVFEKNGDLLGDGVNIAARLEALAPTGGIAISEDVVRQIHGKLDVAFVDSGPRSLKNIPEPVRVWLWHPNGVATVSAGSIVSHSGAQSTPTIAVLPFESSGNNPDQGVLSDGIVDDVITALSRFRSLIVIARSSSFAFNSATTDVISFAKELDVRYVVHGSVRTSANRVRVAVQLLDTDTTKTIWADRFDGTLDDIFDLQDAITDQIVVAVAPEIEVQEREKARNIHPGKLDAWSLYQQGLTAYHATTSASWEEALRLFDEAVRVDPTFAPALAMAADVRCNQVLFGTPEQRQSILEAAELLAKKAISLDPKDPICLFAHGRVQSFLGHHDLAIEDLERAISLNPNFAMAHYGLGYVYVVSGRGGDALRQYEILERLSPIDARSPTYMSVRGTALFDSKRYEESVEWERRATQGLSPRFISYALLAGSLTALGRHEEASQAVAKLLSLKPTFCLEYVRQMGAHYDPNMLKHRLELFRAAGIPETHPTPCQSCPDVLDNT